MTAVTASSSEKGDPPPPPPSATVEDLEKEDEKAGDPPVDKFKFVYWTVLVSGMVCFLPWDILVTVDGYWQYKLREEDQPSNSTELSDDQKQFLAYLSIASSVPSTVVMIVHAYFGKHVSVHNKVVWSLVGLIAAFTGVITLAILDSEDWTDAFMALNLTFAVIMNLFRATFRATTGVYLGKFPVEYISNLVTGTCIGGILPVTVNLIILSMDVDMQMAGFTAFVFACSIVVACLALFLSMERTPFYQYYHRLETEDKNSDQKITKDLVLTILRRIWLFALALALNNLVTLSVYPAVTVLIEPAEPNDSDWHQVYFTQVCCYLTFNVLNLVGTKVASYLQWPSGPSKRSQAILFAVSVLRVAFVPLFIMCNLLPGDRSTEVRIESDAAYICIMAAFSFTDGYLRCLCFMFAPKSAPTPFDQDVTAGVLGAISVTAASLGTVLSSPMINVI